MALSIPRTPRTQKRLLDWTRNPLPPDFALTPFQQFIRNVDWNSSPLGPMDKWPAQLHQIVQVVVADPSPSCVYWGEGQTVIYNEAYAPLIGQKHPALQGQDPHVHYIELWDSFEKIIKDGEETGEAHVAQRALVPIKRYGGFLEEVYYSYKFIPLIGDDGYAVASYATVFEVTSEVLNDRRGALIHHMGTLMSDANNMQDFWPCLLAGFEPNDKDMPLVMLYAVNKYSSRPSSPRFERIDCLLEGCLGIPEGHRIAPPQLVLPSDTCTMDLYTNNEKGLTTAFRKSFDSSRPLLLTRESLPENLLDGIQWRGFGAPSHEFLIIPIRTGNGNVIGFIFCGLNLMRKFDSDYEDHINLVIQQVVNPRASAILLAEAIRQGEDMAKLAAQQKVDLSNQLRQRTREYEQSENRFARFATLANVGVATASPDGRLIYGNPAFYKYLGVAPLHNDALLHTVIPPDARSLQDEWTKVLDGHPSQAFQIRTKTPFSCISPDHGPMQSDRTTCLCAIYPELNEQAIIVSATALIMDISELKWVEDQVRLRSRELEHSEVKYRNFAEHAPIGVALINSDNIMEFANDAWFKITNQSLVDLRARPWLQTVHPGDSEKIDAFFNDLVACRGPRTVETRLRRPWKFHDQEEDSEQHTAWILSSGYSEINSDGTLKHAVCWITDISTQKAVAKALDTRMKQALELKRQQENFVDNISHEIRNPMSAIYHCAEEILTYLRDSITAAEMVSPEPYGALIKLQQPRFAECIRASVEAAQTIVDCVNHQKSIVDDVLTLSKLDSNLLAITPVVVQPDKVVRDAVKLFEGELRTARITWSVLEDRSLKDLNVSWVLLDSRRLHQVLINLVTNAIKFTRNRDRREISVKLGATKERPTMQSIGIDHLPHAEKCRASRPIHDDKYGMDLYLTIAVTDTGKGLSTEEKARLFQRFAQGSPKTHVKYGGSGLGLWISREITEMMDGEIGVASEEGVGSTFMVFVKTQIANSPVVEETVSRSQTNVAPTRIPFPLKEAGPVNVLVVEDNLVNQKVLCRALTHRGYAVSAANHGGEALEALYKTTSYQAVQCTPDAQPEFDVLLMDIEMPHVDGLTCIRQIRALEAQGRLKGHVAVVAVTANARMEHVKAALDAGMDCVTTKPYRMDDLVEQMQKAYRIALGLRINESS